MDPKEIRELREYHDLSLRALAERLGVNKNTVLNWEKGRTSPRGPALEALRVLAGWDTRDKIRQWLKETREEQKRASSPKETAKLAHRAKGLELIAQYFDEAVHAYHSDSERDVEIRFEHLLFALLELLSETSEETGPS